MPVAAYRSTFGVAKDSVHTTLAAAAASGATSITLASAAGISATTWTVTIVDGPLTEQTVASNITGAVLTVPALTNAHSAGAYVTAQATASLGPAAYFPVTVLDVEDLIVQLPDKAMRGSAVEDYGSQSGTRSATVSIGGDVFPDTFAYLVGSICGATDFSGIAGSIAACETAALATRSVTDGPLDCERWDRATWHRYLAAAMRLETVYGPRMRRFRQEIGQLERLMTLPIAG